MKGVKVSSFIRPTGLTDTYPTHIDNFGKGGVHSVPTLEDRNNISADRRSLSMFAFVAEDQTLYCLLGGLTNDCWTKFWIPCEKDYILVGGDDNFAFPSPILIDVRLDLLNIRRDFDLFEQNVGNLKNLTNQKLWIGDINNKPIEQTTIALNNLPALTKQNLWIGDANNRPEEKAIITIDNLPDLGVAIIEDLSLPAGKIWRGTISGRPEESSALSEAIADILLINARFLGGEFILGDALVQTAWPKSQFLINLTDGILKKTGKTLQTAVLGEDYGNVTALNPSPNKLAYWGDGNVLQSTNILAENMEMPAENGDLIPYTSLQKVWSLNCENIQAGGFIAASNLISSGTELQSRKITLFDYTMADALHPPIPNHPRWTYHVGFKAPEYTDEQLYWTLPAARGEDGQVLSTDAANNLSFVFRAPHDAKYILQSSHDSLPNAQALNLLGAGLLKINALGVVAIALGGSNPLTDDYVTPLSLEAIIDPIKLNIATIETNVAALDAALGVLTTTVGGHTTALLGIGATLVLHTASIAALASEKESKDDHNADITLLTGLINNLSFTGIGDVTGGGKISSSITLSIVPDVYLSGKGGVRIPTGATIDRPSAPRQGDVRFNTDLVAGFIPASNEVKLVGSIIANGIIGSEITTTFNANPEFTGQYMTIPVGDITNRPASPQKGMIRFNENI